MAHERGEQLGVRDTASRTLTVGASYVARAGGRSRFEVSRAPIDSVPEIQCLQEPANSQSSLS